MFSSSRGLRLIAAASLLAALMMPAPAFAQRLLVTHPSLGSEPRLSASGRYVVSMIPNRFVADDADEVSDLYRYALDTNTWSRVPHASLVDSPEPGGGIIDVLGISDDGRYVGYRALRYRSASDRTL